MPRRQRWQTLQRIDFVSQDSDRGLVPLLPGFNMFHARGNVFVAGHKFAHPDERTEIRIFICTARLLFNTEDSMATPCSVNT